MTAPGLRTAVSGASVALVLIGAAVPVERAKAGIVSNGLIGYWNADGNANDSSPTGNNGTYSGAYAPGITGQAFDFSGLDRNSGAGSVSIPDIPAYSFGDFSVGFWFNVHGSGNPNVFLGQDNGGGSQAKWFIDYGYQNPGKFEIHLNGPSVAFLPSNSVALPSGWNQFTLTKSGSLYSFYLDGAAIGTQTFAGTFPDPTHPLTFGWAEPTLGYNGLLDDVVIYDRALSVSEAATLAAVPEPSSLALLAAGLVGLGFVRRRKAV